MAPTGASLLDGLAPRERADIVAPLERRRFPAGAVVIAPGDVLRVTYLVESGSADVIVRDAGGREQRLSPISAGETLGEMSFLTGEPAACTVRAATDLDVVVLGEADLDRVSTQYPRVYRNLGAILSQRLARTTRRAVAGLPSRLTVLADGGSPPLLGYALACSIAWHTRAPTLLVVLGEETSDPIAAVAGTRRPPAEPVVARNGDAPADAGAHVIVKRPEGAFGADALPATLEDLFRTYPHVLVQAAASSAPVLQTARVVQLAGSPERAAAAGGPPGHTIRGWADADLGGRPDRAGIVHVPAPDAGDEAHLACGVLPAGSSCGRALAWAARDLAGLQVGLALGAGSVRGYAHVGVLRALERAGVPIDYLAGTSIGAAVAGLHASGHRADEIGAILESFAPALVRFGIPTKGLLSSVMVRKALRVMGSDTRIEDLPVPLALVAADLESGREVVFRRGLAWLAVLASIAIPGVYPAQRVGRYTLVDGGVLNPVPSDVVGAMGADRVIAVSLGTAAVPADTDAEAVEGEGRVPSLVSVVTRTIDIMQSKIGASAANDVTLLIAPQFKMQATSTLGRLRGFSAGRAFIETGDAATEAALPRLAVALPWLRS